MLLLFRVLVSKRHTFVALRNYLSIAVQTGARDVVADIDAEFAGNVKHIKRENWSDDTHDSMELEGM